jgi:hypothetical protein
MEGTSINDGGDLAVVQLDVSQGNWILDDSVQLGSS